MGEGQGGGVEVVKIFLVQHQITIRPRELAVPAVVSSTQLGGSQGTYLSAATNIHIEGLHVPIHQQATKQHQCNIDPIISA